MNSLKKVIEQVDIRMRLSNLIRAGLISLIGFLITQTLGNNIAISSVIAIIILIVGIVKFKIFKPNISDAIHLIHIHAPDTEHSLPLIYQQNLNIAEQLQLSRIEENQASVNIPNSIYYKGFQPYILGVVGALIIYFSVPFISSKITQQENLGLVEQSENGLVQTKLLPKYSGGEVIIKAPAYTNISASKTSNLNIQALIGSEIEWKLKFLHGENLSVRLVNISGEELPLTYENGVFLRKDRIAGSGLYYFKGLVKDSLIYQSEYYKIEAVLDQNPKIEPKSKELYQYHLMGDPLSLPISATISDDFLVREAFIVATLARGSGENVKFREMKFALESKDFKKKEIQKKIDLKALNFSPGDELYYYWAAFDNRLPDPNFTKSDTYFVVFKDTAQIEESELATLAVNIVPEYFRSQRQIIIDTEKLIAKRKNITSKKFGEISNEIGFDQKVLRLRYGQFLGEEFESNIGGTDISPDTGNILEGFTHHSDGQGETSVHESHDHGAHGHDHTHSHDHKPASSESDPLAALMEQYIHAHDDGEINTFHEESTKSLLKMALEQMWQSELNLRLYKPEVALPFEYKALEYLKEAQHKARTYVKKSNYDPPPIKETETRLSGELNDVVKKQQFDKQWKDEQLDLLASRLLGFIDLPILTSIQQKQLLETTLKFNQTIDSKKRTENLTVFILLNKLSDANKLSASEKLTLKRFLRRYADRNLQNVDRIQGNKKLELQFWQKLQ